MESLWKIFGKACQTFFQPRHLGFSHQPSKFSPNKNEISNLSPRRFQSRRREGGRGTSDRPAVRCGQWHRRRSAQRESAKPDEGMRLQGQLVIKQKGCSLQLVLNPALMCVSGIGVGNLAWGRVAWGGRAGTTGDGMDGRGRVRCKPCNGSRWSDFGSCQCVSVCV